MKILALDQSTKHTGWALWINNQLTDYGVIDAPDELSPYERMKYMGDCIAKIIDKRNPKFIVIEQVQFQRNYKTYSQLSQLQGVLFHILFERGKEFTLVEPTKWRAYVGIKGRNRQEQKASAIQAVYDKYEVEVTDDIADAIGIGLWAIDNVKE